MKIFQLNINAGINVGVYLNHYVSCNSLVHVYVQCSFRVLDAKCSVNCTYKSELLIF